MEVCKLCGKEFGDKRGFLGHLRFIHNSEPGSVESARALKDKPMKTYELKVKRDKLFHYVDQLKTIRGRLKELEKMDKSDFFKTDKICQELKESLQMEEKELLKEMQEQGLISNPKDWYEELFEADL